MRLPSGIFNTFYEQDAAILRTPWRRFWFMVLSMFLLLFPLMSGSYLLHLTIITGITIIIAQGLNILMGLCGQVSVAQMAFAGVGAYTSAILALEFHLPFFLHLGAGGLMAGMIGLIFAYPSLRLRGWYLVFTSLAAQQIIIYLLRTWKDLTRGDVGFQVPYLEIAGYPLKDEMAYYYLVLFFVGAGTLITVNLLRTKLGRTFVAIRDNDLAAEGLGISVAGYKMIAFFICCFFAGIGGALWAHCDRYLMPESWGLWSSIWYMGYLVIGGIGTAFGPIYGVICLTVIVEVMNTIVTEITRSYPYSAGLVAAAREGIFGIMVIVFLILEPRGLDHLIKRFLDIFKYWPFNRVDSHVVKGSSYFRE